MKFLIDFTNLIVTDVSFSVCCNMCVKKWEIFWGNSFWFKAYQKISHPVDLLFCRRKENEEDETRVGWKKGQEAWNLKRIPPTSSLLSRSLLKSPENASILYFQDFLLIYYFSLKINHKNCGENFVGSKRKVHLKRVTPCHIVMLVFDWAVIYFSLIIFFKL